jgi:dTDP-4-dehydrorhamnose reductase
LDISGIMPPKSPTLLLTGASGLLGSVLLSGLSDAYHVIGVARTRPRDDLRSCDLSNQESVNSLLENTDPDIIIHTAAMTNVDACENSPNLAFQSNVEMTKFLANWVNTNSPATRFLYISTDQVYDGAGPHSEHALRPSNVYALTKLWAEEYVRVLPNNVILRTNFFGQFVGNSSDLISVLRNRAIAGDPVTLFTDVLFSPLHVDHLADTIADIVRMDVTGIFNVGASGPGMSKAAFARMFIEQMGLSLDSFKDGSVEDMCLAAYRPRDMRMNNEKIQRVLGRELPSVEDEIRLLSGNWRETNVSEESWSKHRMNGY